jgi:DUF4097 and DUF4098 domain-containing protein YvlB
LERYIINLEIRMKLFLTLIFVILGVNQLFALGTLELVNSQTLDMNSVENLTVSYSSDNIVLLESNDSRLVLKEFMTRNNPEYFSKIDNSQGSITITNGKRPCLIRTRIEIYIPKTFEDNFAVNLQSGNLTVNYRMKHKTINLFVSSGNLKTSNISSENVVVEVSSGNITIDELNGNELTVRNGSGKINISSLQGKANIINRSGIIVVSNFAGEGKFDVRSGNIDLTVNDITGDISLSSNSGTIDLIMARNISFFLDAVARSGTINVPDLRRQVNTKVQLNIGSDPVYKVFAKCGSGNIRIK